MTELYEKSVNLGALRCPFATLLFASGKQPPAPEMLQLASIHKSLTEPFLVWSVYSCKKLIR